jgi:hypothetical protein
MRIRVDHAALLRKYVRVMGIGTWEEGQYAFNFAAGSYRAGGKKLHVTPAEALYLYERLLLEKTPKETTCRYAIQRLRERYGAEFLDEYIDSKKPETVIRNEAYKQILQDLMAEDGRMAFIERGYKFDFLNSVYTWDGEKLHVTPKEAVYLYERCILGLWGRKKPDVRRYADGGVLHKMRKKLQRWWFLVDVLDRRSIVGYTGKGVTK